MGKVTLMVIPQHGMYDTYSKQALLITLLLFLLSLDHLLV